jgi:hypothetical protein
LVLVVAAWLALRVSVPFALILGIYFVMTSAYSLRLKRQVIVDVMLLAALYTIRVVAGAVAITVIPSLWLLAFYMFLFLSLAVVKRYSEMLVTLAEEKRYASGRGVFRGGPVGAPFAGRQRGRRCDRGTRALYQRSCHH